MIEVEEAQALEVSDIPLSTLELLKEQKWNQSYKRIMATKVSDPSSCFNKSDNELLRCQQLSKHGYQRIYILHGLRRRLCLIAHSHMLSEHPGVTQTYDPL